MKGCVWPTSRPPEEDDGVIIEGGDDFLCTYIRCGGAEGAFDFLKVTEKDRERAKQRLNLHLTHSPPFINACHKPPTLCLLCRLGS